MGVEGSEPVYFPSVSEVFELIVEFEGFGEIVVGDSSVERPFVLIEKLNSCECLSFGKGAIKDSSQIEVVFDALDLSDSVVVLNFKIGVSTDFAEE